MTGYRDNLNWRPSVPNKMGELQPVHRARHLNVCEHNVNIGPCLQNRDSFIRIAGFNDVEPRIFDHLDRVNPDQKLVLDNQDYASLVRQCINPCPFLNPQREGAVPYG